MVALPLVAEGSSAEVSAPAPSFVSVFVLESVGVLESVSEVGVLESVSEVGVLESVVVR